MKLSMLGLGSREWRRRPMRTAVTALGVALATGALVSVAAFLSGYQRGMRASLERLGAHVLVVPKGCPFDAASIALHGANWPCYLPSSHVAEITALPAIDCAAPALMTANPMPGGPDQVFVGITGDMRRLRPGWRIDGRFPEAPGEILAGAGAAVRHGWRVGQDVGVARLGVTPRRVSGIIAPTGSSEDGFVFLPLAEAQRAFGRSNQLTHVLVRLRDPDHLDDAVAKLRGCNAGMEMNVVPLSHLFRTIQDLLHSTRVWLASVAVVAVLAAASGVGNATFMSIGERTRELGILRAVGATRAQVFLLVWIETLQVCLAGALAGSLGALAASGWTEAWLRTRLPLASAEPMVRPEWWLVGACILFVAAVGSAAGFLPALRAGAIPPAAAMRTAKGR
jgi:putative ABC transport system permease protein